MQQAKGIVLSVAGRSIKFYDQQVKEGVLTSRALKAIVGDIAYYKQEGAQNKVDQIEPRRNVLMRTFGSQDKEMAANLDLVLIVCAPSPLFNTVAIDRILTICFASRIPVALALNKIDLGLEPALDIYRNLDFPLFEFSAKFGQGFAGFMDYLQSSTLRSLALCGISGVGKSTILNRLVPDARRDTAEVSQRTGQGTQTTSQALAYPWTSQSGANLFLIDLPGASKFGISDLTEELVRQAFPEFIKVAAQCKYSDCAHIAEDSCGVKQALSSGEIAPSRYASYLDMMTELKSLPDARKYPRKT